MPWYRTRSGQLVHAVGELADQHAARGAVEEPAPDEAGLAAAQEYADQAAEAAGLVDAATREREATPPGEQSQPLVTFDNAVRPPMSDEEEARVDQAVADETPHRGLFGRRGKDQS